MAITNASRLADFGSGIGTDGAVLEVDYATQRIGLGTTNPNTTVQVGAVGASGTSLFVHADARILGVITAATFYGDGSSLSGVGVAGVSTTGFSTFKDISAQGITTISNLTAATSTTTGALIVSGGVGIAKSLFVGEGISVAGTITYNDVTNVDSIGVITARGGLKIGPSATGIAATIYATGDAHFIGIVTAGSISGGSSVSATTYYGDASNMDNAGISAGKSVGLAAFLL